MPIARIRFGRARKHGFDAADNAAHSYLAMLLKNGQIHEYFLSSAGGRFQACAEVPRRDSLDRRYWPSSAAGKLKKIIEADRKKLIEVFGRKPEITILDTAPAKRPPSWRRARSFYLSTDMLDRRSPVHSPELEEPVPLYLLGLKPLEREWIYFWADSYRAHDKIWMDSAALEMS